MSAARSGVVQPAPTFEHAPSPSAGYQGTRASASRTRPGAPGTADRDPPGGRGARPRDRASRGCRRPSVAPTDRRARSPTPSRCSCGARRRVAVRDTPRTTPSAGSGETSQGRGRGATRVAREDKTCGGDTRRGRDRPSRRRARAAPPPHRRSACPPTSTRGSRDARPARDRGPCARTCWWRSPRPGSPAGRGPRGARRAPRRSARGAGLHRSPPRRPAS